MKILLIIALLVGIAYPRLYRTIPENIYGAQLPADNLNITTSCNKQATLNGATLKNILWTGYSNVGISNSNSALAFIFFGATGAGLDPSQLVQYPTMIWMNGGPGASSQIGNFLEMGPFIYDDTTGKLIANPHTWAQDMNIIFLDQPIGAGFSYAQSQNDIPNNMVGVADQVYAALVNMFTDQNGCFKSVDLIKTPLFISGESYAGKFVPAIGQKIMLQNKQGKIMFNLQGLSIGDGFTDPYTILAQMGMFSFNLGLIDYQERQEIEGYILQGLMAINMGTMGVARTLFYNALEGIIEYSGNVSAYNIRQIDNGDAPAFPFEDFMNVNRPNLGFNTNITYHESSDLIFEIFANDFMARDCVAIVEDLLTNNVPMLIYNGQLDLIVETPGTMSWVDKLRFPQGEEFSNQEFDVWRVNEKVAGYTKSAGSLTYYNINGAGHMVPYDQPVNSYAMISQWITNNMS